MHSRYLETQVLSADPIGLVQLLYAGAIDALLQARTFLQEGRILERSAAISKAMQIIAELQGSLYMDQGGEISQGLAQLYAYMQEKLAEANAQQARAPLEEVVNLLLILQEGWKEAAVNLTRPPVPEEMLAVKLRN